jgi:hypothetical protein
MILALRSIFFHASKGSLTCCKVLRYGADGFSSTLRESVLRIFIALKIHHPLPILNRQILGLMASTLTVTPRRTTNTPFFIFLIGYVIAAVC